MKSKIMNHFCRILAICCFIVFSWIVTGCSSEVRRTSVSEIDVDGRNIVGITDEDSFSKEFDISEINQWIEEYNSALEDETLKIQDYAVIQNDEGYVVVGNNGLRYIIKVDNLDNNSVISGILQNGSPEQQISSATAIMSMLWDKDFIPVEKQVYIDNINQQVTELQVQLARYKMEVVQENIDAQLPTYEDFSSQVKVLQQEFEKLKEKIQST